MEGLLIRTSILFFLCMTGAVCAQEGATPSAAPSQAAAAPSPMVCRQPPRQTGSNLSGMRVCKTEREWAELQAKGLAVDANGRVRPLSSNAAINPSVPVKEYQIDPSRN